MKLCINIPFLSKEINKYLQAYFNKITDEISVIELEPNALAIDNI